ncbi:MAG: ATP-binding protein [Sphaerochaetaceae bacterium]|nr:ATP-binding protein [Sphaerochaetaceae bacterium]
MEFDFEARHIVEALRSGIPSKTVGKFFCDSRVDLINNIEKEINAVISTSNSDSRIISGRYGEGKTHMLNTVFNIASKKNMVVSLISLSKETPFNKLYLIYQKLVNNTYLPNREQPGFIQELDKLTPNSKITKELLDYCKTDLERDKLHYVIKSFVSTDDLDEKYLLQSDLEGDIISNVTLKQIHKRIFKERIKFNENFYKTRHFQDYFYFLSKLFKELGYDGWVILFDETELIGRLGRKTRLNSYNNMAKFLFPEKQMNSVYSVFAITSSYSADVIDSKKEYEGIDKYFPENPEPMKTVLEAIEMADQLKSLTSIEIQEILEKIIDFHGKAYNWKPNVDVQEILKKSNSSGYLLRSKIRVAIEFLDNLYIYNDCGKVDIEELELDKLENELPDLEDEMENN